MSAYCFHIANGLTLDFPGRPMSAVPEAKDCTHVAAVGLDLVGTKPQLAVEEGAHVQAGDVLWCDRDRSEVCVTAPASGTVSAIHRGARRKLLSVVIKRDDGPEKSFAQPADTQDHVRAWLLETGLWSALRARPYGIIPDANLDPIAVFVTAVEGDTLAPDPQAVIALHADAFATGLTVLLTATAAPIILCHEAGAQFNALPDRVRRAEFSGAHAHALPGTHIHCIAPLGDGDAGSRDQAWHIGYQDVIAMGYAQLTGRLWTRRVVSIAGPLAANPRMFDVPLGGCVGELCAGELKPGAVRLIAGGALNGRAAFGAQDYLGCGHNHITALSESLPASQGGTAMGGRPGPILPWTGLEHAWPFDIPVIPLMRALSVCDVEMVKALGGLQLIEEDVAALTFACPSKNEYGVLLRRVLDHLMKMEADA